MKKVKEHRRKTGTTPAANMSAGVWLLRLLQGVLIGSSAILPGISGGVLCVVFGVYRPLMALLSHPLRSYRRYYKLLIPLLLGGAAGFFGFARVVELLFRTSSALVLSLFVGLIAGTFPSLFREASSERSAEASWSGFAISLIVLFAFFSFLQSGTAITVAPNAWWYFFCGVIWGLSIVIPGLSSSSVLIFIGLYQPMIAGIAAVNLQVILPLFAGIILIVAFLARFIHYLLEAHYTLMTRMILGVVIASTLLIIPTEFSGTREAAFCLACFAAGYVVSLGMNRLGTKK